MELELGKLSRNNSKSTAYPPWLLILLGPPVMDPVPVGKKRENESFAWHRVDSDRLIAKLNIGRGRSRSRSRRPMRMMSEQSLALRSLPGNDGAIIVRSGDRRSLIWSRWRSSARLRLWLRSRFRLCDSSLLLFQSMWLGATWGVLGGRIRWPDFECRHLRSIFKFRFELFFGFLVFSVVFLGKFRVRPLNAMATGGDTFFFIFSNCFCQFFDSFICYLFARVCVCVCVLFFSFSMIINMETNKASQTKWREALGERAFG